MGSTSQDSTSATKCKNGVIECDGEMQTVMGFQPVAGMIVGYQACKKCGWIDWEVPVGPVGT